MPALKNAMTWSPDKRASCEACGRDYFESEWEVPERVWDR